jgi:hypothetical protein
MPIFGTCSRNCRRREPLKPSRHCCPAISARIRSGPAEQACGSFGAYDCRTEANRFHTCKQSPPSHWLSTMFSDRRTRLRYRSHFPAYFQTCSSTAAQFHLIVHAPESLIGTIYSRNNITVRDLTGQGCTCHRNRRVTDLRCDSMWSGVIRP